MGNRTILARRFRLVSILAQKPVLGASSETLADLLGVSRPTVDRDLNALRLDAGIRLSKRLVSGSIHHVVNGFSLSLAITPLQMTALRLARGMLASHGKPEFVREIDKLLAPNGSSAAKVAATRSRGAGSRASEQILEMLDAALEKRTRIRIEARVAKHDGKVRSYVLDPLAIRLAKDDGYLDAWSVEGKGLRTFKLVRILQVKLLDEAAEDHPDVNLDELFQKSVKTWTGDPTLVRVRIIPAFAWLAPEYELVRDQKLIQQTDGSVVVEAIVAGIVEASRWALSWGHHAEVLEPPALRSLVEKELRQSLAHYEAAPGDQVRSPYVSEVAPSTPAPASGKRLRSGTSTKTSRKRG